MSIEIPGTVVAYVMPADAGEAQDAINALVRNPQETWVVASGSSVSTLAAALAAQHASGVPVHVATDSSVDATTLATLQNEGIDVRIADGIAGHAGMCVSGGQCIQGDLSLASGGVLLAFRSGDWMQAFKGQFADFPAAPATAPAEAPVEPAPAPEPPPDPSVAPVPVEPPAGPTPDVPAPAPTTPDPAAPSADAPVAPPEMDVTAALEPPATTG